MNAQEPRVSSSFDRISAPVFLLAALAVLPGLAQALVEKRVELAIAFGLSAAALALFSILPLAHRLRAFLLLLVLGACLSASLFLSNGQALALLFSLCLIVLTGLIFSVWAGAGVWMLVMLLVSSIIPSGWGLPLIAQGLLSAFALLLIASFHAAVQKQQLALEELERQRKGELVARELGLNESSQSQIQQREIIEIIAFINRVSAEMKELQSLLDSVTRQITLRLGHYHAGIFLADRLESQLTLVSASSEAGRGLVARGYHLDSGRENLVSLAALQKKSHSAVKSGADAIYFTNPDLPESRSEIAIPLIYQGQVIGVLDIHSREASSFPEDDTFPLQVLADQVAVTIENHRVHEQNRSSIAALEHLSAESIASLWKQHLADQVKGYRYTQLGLQAITSAAPAEPAQVGDAREMRIPLVLRGKEIGSIDLRRKPGDPSFMKSEKEMAARVAEQVTLALENARLLEDSEKRARREETVSQLSSRFSRSLDINTLLQNAVKELHALPQVSEVSVSLLPAGENDREGE